MGQRTHLLGLESRQLIANVAMGMCRLSGASFGQTGTGSVNLELACHSQIAALCLARGYF